ncbi:class I adenylate-forming enzyme family protein [Parahaliea maris]|nr:class I adenylate-forming enzyme family protein [Parahaliea maris]
MTDFQPVTAARVHEEIRNLTRQGEFFEVTRRSYSFGERLAFINAAETMLDILQSARNHGDAEFLVYEANRLTYADFFKAADAFAAWLQRAREIQPGDRVALAMSNRPEWLIAFAGAILVGAIVVPINSWGKADELSFAIHDSGASVVVLDRARFDLVSNRLPDLDTHVVIAESVDCMPAESVHFLTEILDTWPGHAYEVASPDTESACLVLYTSGSTGFPKGVVHHHAAVCQVHMNMMFLGFLTMQLEGQREFQGGATRETPLLTVPLFHATGLNSGFLVPASLGHKVVMMRKWNRDAALQLIHDERITNISSVPAILMDLLSSPDFNSYDTSSLIRVASAGAATPSGLPELIRTRLGEPNRSTGYAMTETLAVATTMSGCVYDLKPDSAGILSPIMEMRFASTGGDVLPPGQPGEIQMRGITCTTGYWRSPEATADVMTGDGWLKSGDIGYLDEDGFLHVTGRIKEIVIRGGENIFPGEIESVAYQHPAVKEVVVFGVDDVAMGEELVMVCYCQEALQHAEVELREFLGLHLAGYKVPRHIVFSRDPLPRNASEKLHKLKVRERFIAGNV